MKMNKKNVNYTFLVIPKDKNVENLQESQFIGLKLNVYNDLILKVNLNRASGRFFCSLQNTLFLQAIYLFGGLILEKHAVLP